MEEDPAMPPSFVLHSFLFMRISIITATYNSGATLRDTFESVLGQTYPDIEYLVIDGASKDNTVDLIRQYEPRFQGRMRWISEPDRGIYDAMNKGIAMATGCGRYLELGRLLYLAGGPGATGENLGTDGSGRRVWGYSFRGA